MFEFIAKFFTGRSSFQYSHTNDQSIKLTAQEETPDNTDAPFFASTNVASQFAYDLDKKSHKYFYDRHFANIQRKVVDLKNCCRSAEHFGYIIPEREMPPKSVLAQLILDGFQLEYRDKKLIITLPTSDIEREADKHLENFMAQMEETKRMEKDEQEAAAAAAAAANAHHEDNTDSAQLTDKNTASGDSQNGKPIPADLKKMMHIQDVIGA